MNAIEKTFKIVGGKLFRVRIETERGRIRTARVSGDFFLHPENAIDSLEASLRGLGPGADWESVVCTALREREAELVGLDPADLARAIRETLE